MSDIVDGASNTYLCGELAMNPDNYETGLDWDDWWSVLTGWAAVAFCYESFPPAPDTPGVSGDLYFGSAHPGIFNMALCDGSVHAASYTMSIGVQKSLASRNGGEPIIAGSVF